MNGARPSNEDLAEQVRRGGPEADEAWGELSPRIEKLIHQIINRVLRSAAVLPHDCKYDDLFQVAQIRALECAKRFQQERGVRFTTYIYTYI